MLESAIQHKLITMLKARGLTPIKINLCSMTGFPDLIVLGPRCSIFFVECKQEGKHPTQLQQIRHEWLRTLGFRVYVYDGTQDVSTFF